MAIIVDFAALTSVQQSDAAIASSACCPTSTVAADPTSSWRSGFKTSRSSA
jgi:hypothetical protein